MLGVGPLVVYVEDPFGLVVSRRELADPSTVVVTPRVDSLTPIRIPGEWSGSGESRPRSIAAAGEEDVTVRPYQRGDDRRRVHWRASAHHAELMVRREEQPWQSRATLVLDNRASAHSGRVQGRQTPETSSWELAVSAAASIGSHLLSRGYSVRLVTDEGGSTSTAWHDRSEGWGSAEGQLLQALATVDVAERASIGTIRSLLRGAATSSGLVVAVLGAMTSDEVTSMARLRHDTAAALGLVLDVGAWPGGRPVRAGPVPPQAAVTTLRAAGWNSVVVARGETDVIDVGTAWAQLGEIAGVAEPTSMAALR